MLRKEMEEKDQMILKGMKEIERQGDEIKENKKLIDNLTEEIENTNAEAKNKNENKYVMDCTTTDREKTLAREELIEEVIATDRKNEVTTRRNKGGKNTKKISELERGIEERNVINEARRKEKENMKTR